MDTAVATQVAEDVLATARGTLDDVIESVRDYKIDIAERAREAKAPKKKRHPFVTLLVLIGLGALAFVVIKRLNLRSYTREQAAVLPDPREPSSNCFLPQCIYLWVGQCPVGHIDFAR